MKQKEQKAKKKTGISLVLNRLDILSTLLFPLVLIILILGFRSHRSLEVNTNYSVSTENWIKNILHIDRTAHDKTVIMPLPEELNKCNVMFISIYGNKGFLKRFAIEGTLSSSAIQETLAENLRDNEIPIYIRVDLKNSKQKRVWFRNKYYWFVIYNPGITAFSWLTKTGTHYFYPGQAVEEGISVENLWDHYFHDWDRAKKIKRFGMASYLYHVPAKKLIPLFRGEPPIPELTYQSVYQVIIDGADYLARRQSQSGRFMYDFDPIRNHPLGGYNALRHAGTTFALFQVYGLTGESRFLEAGDRALNYLDRLSTTKDGLRFIVENNYAKLGGAGLATLALCEREKHVGDGRDLNKIIGYARFMEKCQRSDGDFMRFDPYHPQKKAPLEKSIYYPGEATFALTRLAALTGEDHWQKVALKAARALSTRWNFMGIDWYVPFDAWLLYALSELYQQTEKDWLFDYATLIAQRMMLYQFQEGENLNDDFVGGAFHPFFPQSTPTGARNEGIGAYCHMMKMNGKIDTRFVDTLMRAGSFQIKQAFRDDNTYYVPYPDLVKGGFRKSLIEPTLRIDYTQHNISSLLYLLEWLEEK